MEHQVVTKKFSLTPPIDVTSLGSYMFCPRAGIIAYKQQGVKNTSEEDPRIPNLSYLPDFSVAELRAHFDAVFPRFKICAIGTFGLFFCFAAVYLFGWISIAAKIFFIMLLPLWFLVSDGLVLLSIVDELFNYKNASPILLDPTSTKPIQVMWYDLVKSGYTPWKPHAKFEDHEFGITGQPWRILQSDAGVRIPVLNFSGGEFKVRESQVMRLALYSHLFKVNMAGSKSDWGIVLDVESKQCFAIPISDQLRMKARLELGHFEQLLESDRHGGKTKLLAPAPCANCRFGMPRRFVQGESETVLGSGPIGAFTQAGSSGQLLHSDCGDEFLWTPPHRDLQASEPNK